MARDSFYIDPLAFDFARNEAELGGGFVIYNTDISLQGGLQLNADYAPNFFGQTVAPVLSSESPWGWIILLLAIIGVLQLFQSDGKR